MQPCAVCVIPISAIKRKSGGGYQLVSIYEENPVLYEHWREMGGGQLRGP